MTVGKKGKQGQSRQASPTDDVSRFAFFALSRDTGDDDFDYGARRSRCDPGKVLTLSLPFCQQQQQQQQLDPNAAQAAHQGNNPYSAMMGYVSQTLCSNPETDSRDWPPQTCPFLPFLLSCPPRSNNPITLLLRATPATRIRLCRCTLTATPLFLHRRRRTRACRQHRRRRRVPTLVSLADRPRIRRTATRSCCRYRSLPVSNSRKHSLSRFRDCPNRRLPCSSPVLEARPVSSSRGVFSSNSSRSSSRSREQTVVL